MVLLTPLRAALLLATVLRAAVPLAAWSVSEDEAVFRLSDTYSYWLPAEQLAATGAYESGGEPELLRPPGYPLLLLPGLLLGYPTAVTLFLQLLLGVATVFFVHRLARALFDDERIATTAAWLFALEPVSIAFCSKLMSETLATFFLTLGVWLLAEHWRQPRARRMLGAAVALAAAAFARPIFYYLPVVLFLALLVHALGSRTGRRAQVASACAFLAVAMAPLVAWQVRNQVRAGYAGFSSFGPYNLYLGVAASIRATQEGRPFTETTRKMSRALAGGHFEARASRRSAPSLEATRFMAEEGWRIFSEAPWLYLRPHLAGIARLWLHPGLGEYLLLFGQAPGSRRGLTQLADEGLGAVLAGQAQEHPLELTLNLALGLLLLGTLAFAVLGLWTWRAWRRPGAWALLLTLVLTTALSGGPFATSRFRLPMMPLVCVLAAAGLAAGARRRERGARAPLPQRSDG